MTTPPDSRSHLLRSPPPSQLRLDPAHRGSSRCRRPHPSQLPGRTPLRPCRRRPRPRRLRNRQPHLSPPACRQSVRPTPRLPGLRSRPQLGCLRLGSPRRHRRLLRLGHRQCHPASHRLRPLPHRDSEDRPNHRRRTRPTHRRIPIHRQHHHRCRRRIQPARPRQWRRSLRYRSHPGPDFVQPEHPLRPTL